jgi:hypothetical protein
MRYGSDQCCTWCCIKLSRVDDDTFVCSDYCKRRVNQRDSEKDAYSFGNTLKYSPEEKCNLCLKPFEVWGITLNGRYFCCGGHLDLYVFKHII